MQRPGADTALRRHRNPMKGRFDAFISVMMAGIPSKGLQLHDDEVLLWRQTANRVKTRVHRTTAPFYTAELQDSSRLSAWRIESAFPARPDLDPRYRGTGVTRGKYACKGITGSQTCEDSANLLCKWLRLVENVCGVPVLVSDVSPRGAGPALVIMTQR